MRVLVEQTRDTVKTCLERLGLWCGLEEPASGGIGLHVLMGGEAEEGWQLYPKQDCVLVGTQNMLLSRALNRGYVLSRFRWPVPFGLLNNDALWVFDEVQLMGVAVATGAQHWAQTRYCFHICQRSVKKCHPKTR